MVLTRANLGVGVGLGMALAAYTLATLRLSSGLLNVVVFLLVTALPDALFALWNYKETEATLLLLRVKLLMKRVAMRQTVPDMWERKLPRRANRDFIIFEDRVWTYGDVDGNANAIATWAADKGLKLGDTVVLMMENRPEYVWVWLGLCKLGVTVALINTSLRGKSLLHCIREAHSNIVIADENMMEHVDEVLGKSEEERYELWQYGRGTRTIGRSLDDALEKQRTKLTGDQLRDLRRDLKPSDVLFLIYTSGTTGLPKAAKFKHSRFLLVAIAFTILNRLRPHDRVYCTLPLYHSAGGCIGVGLTMFLGSVLVLRRKFSASNFWKDCIHYRCTVIQYIGELLRYLVAQPESPEDRAHMVTKAIGNGLRPDIWEKFQERFNIAYISELYAATEGNVGFINNQNKVGAVGYVPTLAQRFLPSRIVQFDYEKEEPVRDENGFCIACADGETGEMIGRIVQGDPSREFAGYTRPEATEKKILRNVFRKGDSWFRTGDLMMRDEEGFIYFKDRIGDTFRWKGENVSTCEVAETVSSFEQVEECNVYGVAIPHSDGRAGMAALRLKEGVAPKDFDAKGFFAHVNSLPSYARPIFVRLLQNNMDMTGTFKQKKVDLVKAGLDTDDPVFIRSEREQTYVELSDSQRRAIEDGSARL